MNPLHQAAAITLPIVSITVALRLYGRLFVVRDFFVYDHIFHTALFLYLLSISFFLASVSAAVPRLLTIPTLAVTWVSYTFYVRRLASDLNATVETLATVLIGAIAMYVVVAIPVTALVTGIAPYRGEVWIRMVEVVLIAVVYSLTPSMIFYYTMGRRRAMGYAAAPALGGISMLTVAIYRAVIARDGGVDERDWAALMAMALGLVAASTPHLTYLRGRKGGIRGALRDVSDIGQEEAGSTGVRLGTSESMPARSGTIDGQI